MTENEVLERFCSWLNTKMPRFKSFLAQRYPGMIEKDVAFSIERRLVHTTCDGYKFRARGQPRFKFTKQDLVEFLAQEGVPPELLETIKEEDHKFDHYFFFSSLETINNFSYLFAPHTVFRQQLLARTLGSPAALAAYSQRAGQQQDYIDTFYNMSDQQRRQIRDSLPSRVDFQERVSTWRDYLSDLDGFLDAVRRRIGTQEYEWWEKNRKPRDIHAYLHRSGLDPVANLDDRQTLVQRIRSSYQQRQRQTPVPMDVQKTLKQTPVMMDVQKTSKRDQQQQGKSWWDFLTKRTKR